MVILVGSVVRQAVGRELVKAFVQGNDMVREKLV